MHGSEWTIPGYTGYRRLGAGATGRVVLAVHTGTGTPVAIKYLSARLTADPGFRDAFRAEAGLLGELRSPHLVGLYEYVERTAPQPGIAIVMELINGCSLRDLLAQEGPTGPEWALAVLSGSLLGLAAAHERGVVHRDFKPENVLLDGGGTTRLVDFGIAARSGTAPERDGDPRYLPPEQLTTDPVATPSGDVYAATATFYECLTGRPPFTAEEREERAMGRPVPVPLTDVPSALRDLVRHGLAQDPARRPPDAAAFLAELREAAPAGYGPDWEERAQRKLAALVALLPLLSARPAKPPLAQPSYVTTVLPGGSIVPQAAWRRWLAPAAATAAAVAVALGALASPGDAAPDASARAEATTSTGPTPTPDGGGEPVADTSPPPSPSTGLSSPSPTDGPGGTPRPTEDDGQAPGQNPFPGSETTVRSITITALDYDRHTPDAGAWYDDVSARVTAATDGTEPVAVSARWYLLAADGSWTPHGQAETHHLRGETRYVLDLEHIVEFESCQTVGLTVSSLTADGPLASGSVQTSCGVETLAVESLAYEQHTPDLGPWYYDVSADIVAGTDGTEPVTVYVQWHHLDADGAWTAHGEPQSFQLSGRTRYTLPVEHLYEYEDCQTLGLSVWPTEQEPVATDSVDTGCTAP